MEQGIWKGSKPKYLKHVFKNASLVPNAPRIYNNNEVAFWLFELAKINKPGNPGRWQGRGKWKPRHAVGMSGDGHQHFRENRGNT